MFWVGVLMVLGVYGSDLFLSRISLLILLAGVVLCFGGRQFLKELRFPYWSCCCHSASGIIYNQITFPLQILASKLASGLLPLFGVRFCGRQRHRASLMKLEWRRHAAASAL